VKCATTTDTTDIEAKIVQPRSKISGALLAQGFKNFEPNLKSVESKVLRLLEKVVCVVVSRNCPSFD
jgi:hypothetical protein